MILFRIIFKLLPIKKPPTPEWLHADKGLHTEIKITYCTNQNNKLKKMTHVGSGGLIMILILKVVWFFSYLNLLSISV